METKRENAPTSRIEHVRYAKLPLDTLIDYGRFLLESDDAEEMILDLMVCSDPPKMGVLHYSLLEIIAYRERQIHRKFMAHNNMVEETRKYGISLHIVDKAMIKMLMEGDYQDITDMTEDDIHQLLKTLRKKIKRSEYVAS